jgi:tRNA (mo5U34)-methyltransferase
MFDLLQLKTEFDDSPLRLIAADLVEATQTVLSSRRHGHMDKWLEILQNLPNLEADLVSLDQSSPYIGSSMPLDLTSQEKLRDDLKALQPWRKGPLNFFGTEIDSEWRSDLKWERLRPHIQNLEDRLVLDVGCGNGYYMCRMLGEGACYVLGVDPSQLFSTQFNVMKHFIPNLQGQILPLRFEEFPFQACEEKALEFDTIFSMGILYHRKQPLIHLQELKSCLKKGGELVLETLIIEGGEGELIPLGPYSKMPNVWSIPSESKLHEQLKDSGFTKIKSVDITKTTVAEQRRTEWMSFESLADFLDPNDSSKTIEGHPAPVRIVVTCEG